VGRLLAGLSERSLEANTVVVITADHGEEFLEHGGFEHGHTHYDELLHVPLLIRVPSGAAATIRTVVRQIDVAPTLCQLAGLAPDPSFVGQSLVPLLQSQSQPDRPVLSEGNFWGPKREAWRHDGLKLVRSFDPPQIHLFDLTADPAEQNDVAQRMPDVADVMLEELNLVRRALRSEVAEGRAPALTPQEREHLASLGYLVIEKEQADN
jgi:arylsulfatase A-like enzyme